MSAMDNKVRHNIFRSLAVAFVAMGLLWPSVSLAQAVCPLDNMKPKKVKSLEVFKSIPILSDGRIKPMDTYAENFLLLISGRRHYEKETSLQWFARFIFAPRSAFTDKIFLINNEEILEALKIDHEKWRRYSFRQIEPEYNKLQQLARAASQIEDKNRSVIEKEILRLYSNVNMFLDLSGSMMYGYQHPDFTIDSEGIKKALKLPEGETKFSFFDIIERTDLLRDATAGLASKKQTEWTKDEQVLAGLLNALFFWTDRYANCPLGIIPTISEENEQWLSPMDTVLAGFTDPVYHEEIKDVRDMTLAYWSGTQLDFDIAAHAFMNSVEKRLTPKEKQAVSRSPLELFYNKLNPFLWGKIFYGLAFILFLFSLMSEKKWYYRSALVSVIIAFVPHFIAVFLRVAIMSRPPVSNLYETFIFVGLVAAVLGLLLEYVNKNWLGIVVSSTCGLIFLFIAGKFSNEGDTMQMLVAVLNSNFWLSTHVIAITTGYSGCSVAAILGHVYLLQALAKPNDKKRLEVTYKNMMGILGFGLTMSFLGTTLGGIWADQSWGRFWGWDPKENGALLIILWSAIVFHCRIAKLINPLGAAVGCVCGLIVVMWAWFGVNLLSVGLHSYGFTSGIVYALVAYVVAELVFVAVTCSILAKKGMKF